MSKLSLRASNAIALVSLGIGLNLAQTAVAGEGDLWETTAQAEVPGLTTKLEPIKGQHCAKKGSPLTPPTSNPSHDCQHKDFKKTGDKVTWSIACANPPMTGQGEITFQGEDSYSGVVNFETADSSSRVILTGRKIGTCDNPQ